MAASSFLQDDPAIPSVVLFALERQPSPRPDHLFTHVP